MTRRAVGNVPEMATHETARKVVIAIAAGRIAIGAGALFATRPALGALGFPETDASGLALARPATTSERCER